MKKGQIRALVEQHISAASGNVEEGLATFNAQVGDLVEETGLSLEDVSILDLFEAMCDRDRTLDYNSSQAVQEVMMAAGFPNLVGLLIHPVVIKAYEPLANSVLPLVSQTTSKRKEENIAGFGALDAPERVDEGMEYEEAANVEKYANIKNVKFGRINSITMEMVMFDQTGDALRRAASIGDKMGAHLHRFIVEKVVDIACDATGEAANKSLVLNGTARAKFSNDHTWDTSANDNLGASTFGDAGMITIKGMWPSIYDEKGDHIIIMPKVLLVPEALEVIAYQLMNTKFEVGTADNDINFWYRKYSIVVSPFIDTGVSATAWYIGDPQQQEVLQWVYKPKTETLRNASDKSFRADIVAQFKSGYYAGVGSTDYRFLIQGNA